MRELPILMNGAMVRAVLEGRKTVTRRLVKHQPFVHHWQMFPEYTGQWREGAGLWRFEHRIPHNPHPDFEEWLRPPCQIGDRLYVRETAAREPHPSEIGLTREDIPHTWDEVCANTGAMTYRADISDRVAEIFMDGRQWTPSIHMPKSWARIWLEVTAVRVERLRNITEEQAHAEGVNNHMAADAVGTEATRGECLPATVHGFAHLWDGLAKAGTRWADNPWVWVVQFRQIDKEAANP